MSEMIGGIVRNGVIVPDTLLPEGIRVDIRISTQPLEVPPELQEEFDAWNRASDRALAAFQPRLEKNQRMNKGEV
jgi:hypothetical protein